MLLAELLRELRVPSTVCAAWLLTAMAPPAAAARVLQGQVARPSGSARALLAACSRYLLLEERGGLLAVPW